MSYFLEDISVFPLFCHKIQLELMKLELYKSTQLVIYYTVNAMSLQFELAASQITSLFSKSFGLQVLSFGVGCSAPFR